MKVAAVGDLHIQDSVPEWCTEFFDSIHKQAEAVLLCGDLTHLGTPAEAERLVAAAGSCQVPVLAVLGNHDHHDDQAPAVRQVLKDAGVLLADEAVQPVGQWECVGVKGFGGGFHDLAPALFGESALKAYVNESINESSALDRLLAECQTRQILVMVHYAPVAETLRGESPELFPFLGSSRLGEVIDRYSVAAVVHGHAHHGFPLGQTSGGIAVHNCAHPVLKRHLSVDYKIIEL